MYKGKKTQELIKARILSDISDSLMNKIICNKNVSSAKKKHYWNPGCATDLNILTF
jgi:hypothetical protein